MFDMDNQETDNQDNNDQNTGEHDSGQNNDNVGNEQLTTGKLSEMTGDNQNNGDNTADDNPFANWVNEDGTFNEDSAKEAWDNINKEKQSFEKQALDMRKNISKGKGFDKPEAYLGNYKAPEQFAELMDFTDGKNPEVKTQIDKLAKNFAEKGYTEAHAHDTINTLFETLTDLNMIDARTPEQVQADSDKFMQEQINELGGHNEARQIIGNVTNYIDKDQSVNEEQKAELKSFIDEKGAWAAKYFYNQATLMNGKQAIPVGNAGDGLRPDAELAEEYMNPTTSQTRRDKIMQERITAGRMTPLRFED